MKSPIELSLIFPVLDEAENIEAVLALACQWGPRLADSFEVIVVNDGSTDGSTELVEACRKRGDEIRVIHHSSNLGYGAALRSGLRAARGEWIFFTDADLQFDFSDLKVLLDRTSNCDLVAGYRAPRQDPWIRHFIARVWALLMRCIFQLSVRDIDCAFKVFHRDLIERIPLESLGAFINTEILVRAANLGIAMEEVPVRHLPRKHGKSKGISIPVILKAISELIRLQRELRGKNSPSLSPSIAWTEGKCQR